MKCGMQDQVLAYLRGSTEVDTAQVEAHIESCRECAALVEGYMQKEQELSLELEGFWGEDKKLKEQVDHFEKGTRRIIIFTLVGLLMGWFSVRYYTDSFIVTKVILAIPYKLGEMLHNVLHQAEYGSYRDIEFLPWFNEFFPGDYLCTFLAERIVPVLFGGAVYGSLAYFTGDKRIFTLKRYLKFGTVWAAVILGFTGMTFWLNAGHERKLDAMEGITRFMFYGESSAGGYEEECIREAFYRDGMPERVHLDSREPEAETALVIGTALYKTEVSVNYEARYMVTKKGTTYRISRQFADYGKEYGQTGRIADVQKESIKEAGR